MTVSAIRNLLLKYVGPAGTTNAEFLASLNQVRRRFFDSGKWNGLELEVDVVPVSEIVILPASCEAVLGAQFDGRPVTVFSRYLEFLPGGPGEITAPQGGAAALIDQGDRTYKIMGASGVVSVHLVCKRRFADLTADGDTVLPDNVGAIKLGLMGLAYEDANDLDRSVSYFGQALALLDNEVEEAQGAARHVLQTSPHGFYLGAVRNLY